MSNLHIAFCHCEYDILQQEFNLLFVLFLYRSIAKHYLGERGLYLVQSHGIQGSRNCGKEVSINYLYIPTLSVLK